MYCRLMKENASNVWKIQKSAPIRRQLWALSPMPRPLCWPELSSGIDFTNSTHWGAGYKTRNKPDKVTASCSSQFSREYKQINKQWNLVWCCHLGYT